MTHNFDVKIATEYGVYEAIVLNNLAFWVIKNQANEYNFYEDMYWTYNTKKAFSVLLPYFSEHQLRRILDSLEERKVILSGNFNKSPYDRTKWYTIIDDLACSIYGINQYCRSNQIDLTDSSNGSDEVVNPIPDSKPFINQIKNSESTKDDFQDEKSKLDIAAEPEVNLLTNTGIFLEKDSTKSKAMVTNQKNSRAREEFDEARRLYLGKKDGLDTEFDRFIKIHKDWKEIIPKLKPAILIYNNSQTEKKFLKHFQRFIKTRHWESWLPEEPETTPEGKMLPIFPEHLNKKMFKESEEGRKYYDEKTAWFDKFITSNCPEFTPEQRDKVWKGIIESHLHLFPTNDNVIKFLNQTIDRTIYITDYFK